MSIAGIGHDLTEIERIRGTVARSGERFLRRCFTENELLFFNGFADPAPQIAARFAAKEAAAKALGTGISSGIGWRDIEVVRDPAGPPRLVLHGEARARAAAMGAERLHLTLTHCRGIASAVVVFERLSP